MVFLVEAPVRANAIADLFLQEHMVEAAKVRASWAGLQLSPGFPMGH